MTTLQQWIASQEQPEVPVNENFDSLSASAIYSKRHPVTTGLTWGYHGGLYNGNTIADGTVTLTNTADNYVVVLRSTGVVSTSTSSANSTNPLYAKLYKVTCAGGVVSAVVDQRWDANGLLFGSGGAFTGGTLTSALNEAPIVTIASSSTVNIGSASGNTISVTGTTTITAFDSIASGAKRDIVFAGILLLTHNATSLILPTGANITTAAGDSATFLSLGSGNWRCLRYERADGTPLVGGGGTAGIPQNSQSTAYTLVLGDANYHILHPSADTTARTFTIPANSSVAFPVGTAVTFVNQNAAGVITIAITTDTMRLAGAGTTGSRTLAANGIATALKITSTEWIISGTGLT